MQTHGVRKSSSLCGIRSKTHLCFLFIKDEKEEQASDQEPEPSKSSDEASDTEDSEESEPEEGSGERYFATINGAKYATHFIGSVRMA